MTVSNNILWAQTGYDLNLTDDAAIGFASDYNDLYVTGSASVARISNRTYPALSDWVYEYGFDSHSISADPQFVNPAGPDGILGFGGGVDHGADDNFHLQPTSPAIDAGNPTSAYFLEPQPNGSRINLGNFGNTPHADSSAAQLVQITSPSNLQKLQDGKQYPLSWQTAGVTANQPVLLMDVGGPAVGYWIADSYSTVSESTRTVTNAIDTSLVSNPAPQQVYQSYAWASPELAYSLPVPNGTYTLRLHFMDEVPNIGKPVMNIKINGVTVQSNFDLFATAGAAYKAVALSFTATASGGTGLLVEVVAVSGYATLSGIELTAANPMPVASPTANLQLSTNNGASWTTIATNQPLDAWGRGSYLYTPTVTTSGATALFRVSINNTSLPYRHLGRFRDLQWQHHLLRQRLFAGRRRLHAPPSATTPTPAFPLLAAGRYPGRPRSSTTQRPATIIYVDTGTYTLVHDLDLTSANAGLTIQGPSSAGAVINRANTSDYDFYLNNGASNITLDHLSISGGLAGIYGEYSGNSTNNTISTDLIYSNAQYGIELGGNNTGWTITGNTIHDNSGTSFVARGIDDEGNPITIANNTIFNEPNIGIYISSGPGSTISGNQTYADGTGIQAAGALTISNNLVHDNTTNGIYVSGGALVTANIVYRQIATNAVGILLQGAEARSNTVYYNYNGVVAISSTDTIDRNDVYSNTNFGVLINGSNGAVTENLIYADSAAGIVLTSSSGEQIVNNTVYQLVGDAVRFTSSPNAIVRSNILWVEAGDDLDLTDTASQAGMASDYNDLYRGAGASARVGFWAGAIQDQLSNWQTASSQDAHSISANPLFTNVKGADQVLGYNPAGAGYNGGVDDNFYPSPGSPAIDRGYTWSGYNTDILNQPRSDDPGTSNAGSPNYVPAVQSSSLYALTGTAQGWQRLNMTPIGSTTSPAASPSPSTTPLTPASRSPVPASSSLPDPILPRASPTPTRRFCPTGASPPSGATSAPTRLETTSTSTPP